MTQEQEQKLSLTLTPQQWEQVTKIQDDMIADITHSTKAIVKTACELMEKLGVPKQEICYLICERAEEWEFSEGYLRRLVPNEYKNQAQRDTRLTHEGEPQGSPAQTKTLQVNNGQDIKFETTGSTTMKKGRLTASETIQKYKDEAMLANRKLAEYRVDNDYTPIFIYIREQRSDAELAEKVRNFMKQNKTYKEWLKQEDAFEDSITVEGKTKEEGYLDKQQKAAETPKKSKSKSKSKPKSVDKKSKNKSKKASKENKVK